jgi:hypothetical protein
MKPRRMCVARDLARDLARDIGLDPVFDVVRARARRRDDGLDRHVDLDRVHDLACNLADDLADDVAYGLSAARARTMDRARLLGKALTYGGGTEEQNQRLDLLIRLLCEQADPAACRLGATRPAWWLTAAAIRILPDAHRHRYAQEFTAELADLAHLPRYRQVAYAIRLASRMMMLRRALGEPVAVRAGDSRWLRRGPKYSVQQVSASFSLCRTGLPLLPRFCWSCSRAGCFVTMPEPNASSALLTRSAAAILFRSASRICPPGGLASWRLHRACTTLRAVEHCHAGTRSGHSELGRPPADRRSPIRLWARPDKARRRAHDHSATSGMRWVVARLVLQWAADGVPVIGL